MMISFIRWEGRMARAGLSTDPEARMGIYKRLHEVPDRYRLEQYASSYRNRDVWAEWLTARQNEDGELSTYLQRRLDITERSWKEHMKSRGRHHALAGPDDVETWVEAFVDGTWQLRTIYEGYWVHVAQFYHWLRFHTDHPHAYDPVLMAAADSGASSRVWACKVERWEGRDDTE